MTYVAVDKDGIEYLYEIQPIRDNDNWCESVFYSCEECNHGNELNLRIKLPKGSIKKLTGKELTWNDNPIELN